MLELADAGDLSRMIKVRRLNWGVQWGREGGREGGAQIVCVFKHFIIVFMSCTHM